MARFVLLALLCGSAPAAAHPFGSSLPAQSLDVVLDRGHLHIDYLVEQPTADALRELAEILGKGPRGPWQEGWYPRAREDELIEGLALVVDGVAIPLERAPVVGTSGVGDQRFVSWRIGLDAALPAEARTLSLRNGNLPDSPNLFNTRLRVTDALVLDAASLYVLDGERLVADRDGQWRMEEDSRELRASFRPRAPRGAALHARLRRLAAGMPVDATVPGAQALTVVDRGGWGLVNGRIAAMAGGALLLLGVLGAVLRRWRT